MGEEKPWRERFRQDMVIVLMVLLLLGGSASFLSISVYFVPAVLLFLLVAFGPHVFEFMKETLARKEPPKSGKVIITAIHDGDTHTVWVERDGQSTRQSP